MPDSQKPDAEQRALNEVNQGASWLKVHLPWLAAVVAALVLGFIVGHLV